MIKKNVENSGGTVRLGYSFNCSSTPKPTIDWDYTQTDGFHVTIGDSEITVVVDENDTGSNSRTLVITPYIDGDPCKDNRIQISQGAGDEPGECSYEVTAAKTVINCEDDHVVRFTFKKVEEDEPTGCKIPLTAKTINGLTYDYNTMRLDASGDTLTFSHGSAPDPPAGDCSGTWNKDSDLSTVFSKARGCTVLNNNWQACPNGSCTNSVIIVLRNNTSKQVPYNGHFKITSNGVNSYVDYRVQTPPDLAGGTGHYYYGASGAEGQQSNFTVPKNGEVELVCSADTAINTNNVTAAIVYFSNLESGENDYRLHNGQFNTAFGTISVSVESGKIVITSFYEKYCIDDGSTYKKNDKSTGNGTEIIPTNLWNM